MRPLKRPAGSAHRRPARLVGCLVLGALLLAATLHSEALYALFGGWWHRVVGAFGFAQPGPGWPQAGGPIGPLLYRARSVPAVLLYGVLYLGLCFGLLFLLVPGAAARRQALLFYGGLGLATGLLYGGGRAGGGPALTELARQLLHFIFSPVPVIVLVPLLRWAAAQPAGR